MFNLDLMVLHANMFWFLYFLLCTCSASSIVNKKESHTQVEKGLDGFDLVIRLTGKMESLSEKLNSMDKQLQQETGRSRSSELDLAVIKTREKCIQDELKELKAAYSEQTDDRKGIVKLTESMTKLQSVVDQLLLQRDEDTKERAQFAEKVTQLRSEMQSSSDKAGTATFIRWGRTTCPTGNNVIYKGFAAGNKHTSKAGTANMLCLSEEPIYANHSENVGEDYRSSLYGTEYETRKGDPAFGSLYEQDMPCVVCVSQSKHSSVMMPGRNKCTPGWTREYWGYLMGPHQNHASAQYICVDTDAESIAGGSANDNGNVLYLVESICGSLKCPPYKNGWELSCAVCSR